MSPRRKALSILSWITIAFGIVVFVFACVLIGLSADLMSQIPSGTTLEIDFQLTTTDGLDADFNGSQLATAAVLLGMLGALFVFIGIVYIVIGILGRRGAKNPRKIVPFMVVATFGLLLATCDLFALASTTGLDATTITVSVLSFIFPALGVYLAYSIRLGREDVAEGAPLGPDGDEYEDGFNPRKLGFMRVLQVFFVLNIIFSVLYLTTLIKGNYELDFNEFLNLFNVIADGVLFWFLWQRYRSTRWVAMGLSIFNIVVGTGYHLVTDVFDPSSQLFLCMGDIIVLIYFSTSRRVQAALTQPFSVERVEQRLDDAKKSFYNPRTWAFWRSIIIYFCLFSIVGHWMEAAFCLLIKYGIVPGIYDPNSQIWSDWLYPFPVYGFGTVACALILYPIKNALQRKIHNGWGPVVASFVVNTLVCSAIELALGLLQNQPVNGVYPLWDYSNMFCNFMGQICLQNSLAFGAVATLMTWIIYPGLEKLMGKLPNNVANVVFIVVIVFFAIVFSLYCINVVVPDFAVVADAGGVDMAGTEAA